MGLDLTANVSLLIVVGTLSLEPNRHTYICINISPRELYYNINTCAAHPAISAKQAEGNSKEAVKEKHISTIAFIPVALPSKKNK